MIHCVGNSHAYFFTGTDVVRGKTWHELKPKDKSPHFKSYNIGAATAWNFPNKHIRNVRNLRIKHGERLMLVLGEVDCRWHIPHPFKHKRNPVLLDWPAHLVQTIDRYFAGIEVLAKFYDVCIWGVHPPSRNELGPEFPMYGNCEFRTEIVRMWNRYCWEKCKQLGIDFYCIFWNLVKDDGMVNQDYLLDDCHLSQKAMPFALKEMGL